MAISAIIMTIIMAIFVAMTNAIIINRIMDTIQITVVFTIVIIQTLRAFRRTQLSYLDVRAKAVRSEEKRDIRYVQCRRQGGSLGQLSGLRGAWTSGQTRQVIYD